MNNSETLGKILTTFIGMDSTVRPVLAEARAKFNEPQLNYIAKIEWIDYNSDHLTGKFRLFTGDGYTDLFESEINLLEATEVQLEGFIDRAKQAILTDHRQERISALEEELKRLKS